MAYQKTYSVKEEHIDVQGIMDGLYYPFYMEWCRHDFIKDELGFDLNAKAVEGLNMVLAQFTMRFKRPVKKGDELVVTCSAHPDQDGKPRFHLRQQILCEDKVMTEAVFTATCIPAAGGRPFVPEDVANGIKDAEPMTAG